MIYFLLILSFELWRNWYVIAKKERSPNHARGAALRVLLFFLYALISYDADWGKMAIYIVACHLIFWFSFDVILNILLGRNAFQYGSTSWIDKHTKGILFIFLKFILMLLGIVILLYQL